MKNFNTLATFLKETVEIGQAITLDESVADQIRELLASGETGLTAIANAIKASGGNATPQQVYAVKKDWLAKQGITPVTNDVTVASSTPKVGRTGTKSETIRQLLLAGGKSVADIAREAEATPTQVYGIINALKAAGQNVDVIKRVKIARDDAEEPVKRERTRAKGRANTAEEFVDNRLYEYLSAVDTAVLSDIIDFIKTSAGDRFDDIEDATVNALIYRRIQAQLETGGVVFDGSVYRLPNETDNFDEDEPDPDDEGDIDTLGLETDDDEIPGEYVKAYKGKSPGKNDWEFGSTWGDGDEAVGNADLPWDAASKRLGYTQRIVDDDDDDLESDEDDLIPDEDDEIR